jgi:hypothetical protein
MAASGCRPTGCGGCWVATASALAPDAMGWWPATTPHPSRSVPRRRLNATWTWTTSGSWSSWTASASAGSAAPRAPCGSTPPSTSPRPTPGDPAGHPPQSLGDLDQPAGQAGRRRPRQSRLAAGVGHERQRQRVPLGHVPAEDRLPRRPPPLHPSGRAADERLRGAGPADHPGGVLEANPSPAT